MKAGPIRGVKRELKQELIEEGAWENLLENWEQYAENIRHRWQERFGWN